MNMADQAHHSTHEDMADGAVGNPWAAPLGSEEALQQQIYPQNNASQHSALSGPGQLPIDQSALSYSNTAYAFSSQSFPDFAAEPDIYGPRVSSTAGGTAHSTFRSITGTISPQGPLDNRHIFGTLNQHTYTHASPASRTIAHAPFQTRPRTAPPQQHFPPQPAAAHAPATGLEPNAQLAPLDPDNLFFSKAIQARAHLRAVAWRPKSGNIGVPKTEATRIPYVKSIYDAIVSLRVVHDSEEFPQDYAKFRPGGMWSNPQDIEAVAHKVVDTAVELHERGVIGLHFRRDLDGSRCALNDRLLTFTERIFYLHILLKHFKSCASLVMRGECIELYLARIWTTLMEQPKFHRHWTSISIEQKTELLRQPYMGTKFPRPTPQQRTQWREEATKEMEDQPPEVAYINEATAELREELKKKKQDAEQNAEQNTEQALAALTEVASPQAAETPATKKVRKARKRPAEVVAAAKGGSAKKRPVPVKRGKKAVKKAEVKEDGNESDDAKNVPQMNDEADALENSSLFKDGRADSLSDEE